jgi:hypothetical protein
MRSSAKAVNFGIVTAFQIFAGPGYGVPGGSQSIG